MTTGEESMKLSDSPGDQVHFAYDTTGMIQGPVMYSGDQDDQGGN